MICHHILTIYAMGTEGKNVSAEMKSVAEIRKIVEEKMISEITEFEIIDEILISYNGWKETVVVPNGVTEIGRSAFKDNKTMKSILIPDTVNNISSQAFAGCDCLEEIDIPGSVRVIEGYAFMRCGNLKSVTLHEGLREIGLWAFGNCNQLKEISIPDSVKQIGQYALGFTKASYEERYIQGMYHSFNNGFHIHHNENAAAIKYIAFHKLSLRLVRS